MKRFLLVEGRALFREYLALLLEWRTGFASVQAGSFDEARQFMGSPTDIIGMAIVNVELPDRSGIELIEKLRETKPDMPILALTALRDPDKRVQALRAGADAVCSVRENREELIREAKRLGGGGRGETSKQLG